MKAADQTIGTTTLVDVTDLTYTMAANQTIQFEALISFTSPATNTGIKLGVTGPGTPTSVLVVSEIQNTATTWTTQALNAYGAFTGTATTDIASVPRMVRVTGFIRNGATAGAVTLQAAPSRNAAAFKINAGSTITIR